MINLISSLLHLFYPQGCAICGLSLASSEQQLCLQCLLQLPVTSFQHFSDNPVEKLFYGRVNIQHAMAAYYFSKASVMRKLVHQVKYKHKRELGVFLGKQMGQMLLQSNWIQEITCIVPVPVHPKREKARGYNQAALLAKGIAAVTGIPLLQQALIRTSFKGSQTSKGRILRWQNVSQAFQLINPAQFSADHILLVDDVITTGATTEACGRLFQDAKIPLSICCLAYARH